MSTSTIHQLLTYDTDLSGSCIISNVVPTARQPVSAPASCVKLLGKAANVCAIKLGSVRGVKSSCIRRRYVVKLKLAQMHAIAKICD